MNEDPDLLSRYVACRSDAAFTTLVQRHVALVYGTALRQLAGDAHLAQDVAQTVFTDLARKARSLRGRPSVAGWLYVSTRHASAAVVRAEQRRKARELRAHDMNATNAPGADPEWERIRPVLDDAMRELGEIDREAVVLRFFQQRSLADIAAALRLTDEAARKRIDRALEKLRTALARRGIGSTIAAVGATLGANAASAEVPASLSAAIAAHALQTAAPTTATALMATAKSVVPIAAALAAGGWWVSHQHAVNARLQAEVQQLTAARASIETLQHENDAFADQVADADALRGAARRVPALRSALVERQAAPPAEPTPIMITPEGTIKWRDRFVSLAQFLRELKALHASAPDQNSAIVIHARGATLNAVAYPIDEARKIGIRHVIVDSDAPADPRVGFTWF